MAGNDFVLSGEAVWQLLRGDWFDAATLYRDWARREARWWPRLAAGVAELQGAGVFVMPYINGRLWDSHDRGAEDFAFSTVALYFDAGAREVWLCTTSGAMTFLTSASRQALKSSRLCPQFPKRVELRSEEAAPGKSL